MLDPNGFRFSRCQCVLCRKGVDDLFLSRIGVSYPAFAEHTAAKVMKIGIKDMDNQERRLMVSRNKD